MTDTCIVCLGDLLVAPEDVEKPQIKQERNDDQDTLDHIKTEDVSDNTNHIKTEDKSENKSIAIHANQSKPKLAEDDEVIAHLLPCGHNLHNSCLKPWVERANSCPICRAQFNMVELRQYLDSPAYDSYAVQDKQQEAEIDPTLIIDDELFDMQEPCVTCHAVTDDAEVMYCDDCDCTVHVFCAGFSEAPEHWYCDRCLQNPASAARPSRRRAAPTTTSTARPQNISRAARRGLSEWDRVWQQVWSRLDLDLDFPYLDEGFEDPLRTMAHRLELQAWQDRLNVANSQGTNRFRDTASTLLHHQQQPPAPESQDEVRAWSAFDKARTLDEEEEEKARNRRKRKSPTASPSSTAERKLKRPRTRRNAPAPVVTEAGPSTARPMPPRADQPSFLTSLLQEVEKQPALSDSSSPDVDGSGDEALSPYERSPHSSPLISGQVSPRASSLTPPPEIKPRPASPTPLTSIIMPRLSNTSPPFSPFSPATGRPSPMRRARRPPPPSSPVKTGSPGSPSRNMSYSTKTEIQRMVKASLGPRYRKNEITKDQYTDINRDISRLMYDKVGDAEGLANQEERNKWQRVAHDEVEKAIELIRADEQHGEVVKKPAWA